MFRAAGKRLVVIPNDPISTYVKGGFDSYLEGYFNPRKVFKEVFAISPYEEREYQAYGMTILPAPEHHFQQIIGELRPDVVRAYAGHWPADLACKYRVPGVPVVVSVHDTHPSMFGRALPFADLVVCVSTAVEEQVLARGVDPKRIRLLPNRYDAKIFHPIKAADQCAGPVSCFPPGRYIFQLGRKVPQKNIDTIIRALVHLPAEYSCIFAGMGDRQPFQNLAEEVGVGAR